MKPYAFSGMLCTSMLIFGLIGYNIDGWLHTTPLFVIVGLMYSIIGSIILLIKNSWLISFIIKSVKIEIATFLNISLPKFYILNQRSFFLNQE